MKILIVKTFPQEINLKTYNSQEIGLALAFKKKGHEADVMCSSDDGAYHEHDIELEGYHIKLYCVKAVRMLKNGWMKDCDEIFARYDILHVSEYNQMYTRYLAKKYMHKTVIYHGPYYCSFNKNYNLMARVFDMFFLNRYKTLNTTFITKSRLAEKYLRDKGLKNVYAIGVGISTTFLIDQKQGHLDIADEVTNRDGVKLIYVGVIEERRNALFLLDVLSELKKRRIACTLVLVGKYRNDKYKAHFQSKIVELKLQDYIIYKDVVQQKDISQLYEKCDILLLPTRYDIYGMILLEAMYYGLTAISTLCGGSEMMIQNGKNGYIIDEYDAAKWADCVSKIMSDTNAKKKLGEEAKRTIMENFTWDALADKILSIYNKKLEEK